MTATIDGQEVVIHRLDTACSGECALGCGRPAFPYGADGFTGYVDACSEHARTVVLDAIEDGTMDNLI